MTRSAALYDDPEASRVPIHDAAAFEGLRRAGRLAAECLDIIAPYVVPGVSTGELDRVLERHMRQAGAIPACLGYRGYPKATCISPNHVVCHGIPDDRKTLVKGDIVNIDVTVILDGWYGDTSRMYLVGEVGIKPRRLVDATYDAMMLGIATIKPGSRLGDVGAAIQSYVEPRGMSVVRDFCGHGIGRVFHAAPSVLHFGKPGTGLILRPGMVFTVEPMINAGRADTKVLSDGWTAVTRDKSPSAQFEHMIGVTDDGVEIFTLSPAGHTKPPYSA